MRFSQEWMRGAARAATVYRAGFPVEPSPTPLNLAAVLLNLAAAGVLFAARAHQNLSRFAASAWFDTPGALR
jgi:hypothetical protein